MGEAVAFRRGSLGAMHCVMKAWEPPEWEWQVSRGCGAYWVLMGAPEQLEAANTAMMAVVRLTQKC